MMWHTDTIWFDVAVVSSLLAVRSLLLGRFEEHKPVWLRLLVASALVAIVVVLSAVAGRIWAFAALLVAVAFGFYMHAWWLPQHGVNGWTGEPRDKYLEWMQRGRKKTIKAPH
jgi:hypothetical protein